MSDPVTKVSLSGDVIRVDISFVPLGPVVCRFCDAVADTEVQVLDEMKFLTCRKCADEFKRRVIEEFAP